MIRAFESSPFDGQTVSGAGEVPIGAVAIGIDVAKVISPGHVLGAGPRDRGEAGIVEESSSFLFWMASHEPGHFSFFGGPSVARDGAGVDRNIVGSAAGNQDEARDEADNKEAQLDARQDDSSHRLREAKVLKFFMGEKLPSFTTGDSLLVCPNEAVAPCGINDRVIMGRRIEGSFGQSPGIERSLAGVCQDAGATKIPLRSDRQEI